MPGNGFAVRGDLRCNEMRFPFTWMLWLHRIGPAALLIGLATAPACAAPDAEADDRLKELIVVVRSDFGGRSTEGAGIVFGAEADRIYILTANHNVRGGADRLSPASQIQVQFRWLPAETMQATLLNSFDQVLDLAVITVKESPGASLRLDWLGDSDALSPGDSVNFLGHPNGHLWELTVKPSAVSRLDGTLIYFQSELVAPGNSGGGLFNQNRELVGMVRKADPPYGEAVSIVAALQWLQRFNYPILLSRPGSASTLAAFESEIAEDVKYNCLVLHIWPEGAINGADIAKRLAAPLAKVERNPLFRHSRSAQIGSLYRCMGGATLISGEISTQIPLALPYLERSLEFDPSQFLLRRNVATLQTAYRNGRSDFDILTTATLQVVRGGDDPDIPALEKKISSIMHSPERQAQDWLLHNATTPSLSEMLDLMRLKVKNEGNRDLPLEVSTRTLDSGLIEVKAAIGPSNFIWEVDYPAKAFTARNDLAGVLTQSVKPIK